jgi:predicted ATPase
VSAILDRVIDLMMEAVHRYEGTVNQVLGDGLMALFGAPIAHEDHAVRACYAALRMQERVGVFADEARRVHGVSLQIRVGLNSGEVVVRAIGGDLHMALSAVGQTVHLASRMERLARPGTILATAGTIALVGSRVRTRPLGPMRVKGLAEPVEACEVVGAATGGARREPAGGRASPFLGREAELAALEAELAAAIAERGRVVAIAGEPGAGKTRLLQEFLGACRARGCLVLDGAAVSVSRAIAHRAGMDLVRAYFGVEPDDDAAAVRGKVTARMLALGPDLDDDVPALLWILGALPEGSPFHALEPASRRQRANAAVGRLVRRESERQPVVMAVDDLQWADSETVASFSVLQRDLPRGALLVTVYRSEYDDAWLTRAGAVRVRLGPLPAETTERLLDALLGGDLSLSPLRQALLERVGGNPLFLEESIRDLAQRGVLAGARGAYRLERPTGPIEVPATVRSVLEARIDRLPPEPKRLLQCAAVLGEEVPASLLEALAELPPPRVREAVASLAAAELVHETAAFPEPRYVFRHSLIHDVAYGSLLHDRRRMLHARAMQAIEELYPARRTEHLEQLAHHAFRGEAWDQAVRYAREAGAKMLAGVAGREAVGFFETALTALGHLDDRAEHRALAVDLRDEMYNALVPLGEHARVLEVLREAAELAERLGDDRRLARTLALLSNTLHHDGNLPAAIEAGERAVSSAERAGEPDLEAVARFSIGSAFRALGDYRRAEALLRKTLSLLGGASAGETLGLAGLASVVSRSHLAWSLAELGEFPEARRLAAEAIAIASERRHAYSQAQAHLGLGGTLLRQGRMAEALPILERGLALSREAPVLTPPLAGDLGVVYALSGRLSAGLELAERAVAQAERFGRRGRLSLIVTHLGEIRFLAGELDDAARDARRALELAKTHGERGNEVYALRLAALAAAERDPPEGDAALERYGDALVLAGELGMRPLAARCHLGLGRLLRRLGEVAEAERHVGLAAELLRALDMQFWLDRLALDHTRWGRAGVT